MILKCYIEKYADLDGYNEDFLKMFGFSYDNINYDEDIDIDINANF